MNIDGCGVKVTDKGNQWVLCPDQQYEWILNKNDTEIDVYLAQTGTMNSAYILCSILLMASALISMWTKAPTELPTGNSWIGRIGQAFAMARR